MKNKKNERKIGIFFFYKSIKHKMDEEKKDRRNSVDETLYIPLPWLLPINYVHNIHTLHACAYIIFTCLLKLRSTCPISKDINNYGWDWDKGIVKVKIN